MATTNALMRQAKRIHAAATKDDQETALRDARTKLGVTSEELAELLGVTLPALERWLTVPTSNRRREMPLTARLLLVRILKG